MSIVEDEIMFSYINTPETDLCVDNAMELDVLANRLDDYVPTVIEECNTLISNFSDVNISSRNTSRCNSELEINMMQFEDGLKRKALLTETEDLERKLNSLREIHTERIENQNTMETYSKILKTYSSLYKFNIHVTQISSNIIKIELCFMLLNESFSPPITFTLNTSTKKIQEFNASAVCSSESQMVLKNQYLDVLDLPLLISQLRSCVLK